MKFSDYLIGNQGGQPMYSQVQTPIQPQQMQSIAPQQSMQSSVTDFGIKPNQSAPKKKVETFDVLGMLEKTNQFTQQAIKDNPAPVKREYSGRDKNIIEVKKGIEDSLRETHKLNTLLDMKRYVDDGATLEEIQQDFQDIPQEVIGQIYNEFSFGTKFKDILKLYPELDSIQVPQELSNKYDIRKYFNPLGEAGKTILEAKQRSKEEGSLLTSNPLTQGFMSAIGGAVKGVGDLGAGIVGLSDTINAGAKSVTQGGTIDQYKERPTTTSEDALNIFGGGTTTVGSVFALPAITLINAGIESLPEEGQRALADSMDWLGDKIAQTPGLKQWMQSLPPDRQAEFKQELANAGVGLLLGLKNKKNIVTDPKTFLKENINPIDIAKNFNENVLGVPKSAGELVEGAMNEAGNKIYTTVKGAKGKLSTMTKGVKGEVSFGDRVIAVMNGLDAETVRKFKDSPDIVKALDEGKITKESIKTDLVSAVDDVLSERNEVGSQYSEVYRNPMRFDTNDIIADINSSLLEQGVKIKDNKIIGFDTTKMPGLTDQAKTALKSKYKDTIQTLEGRSDLSVKELHNIRKDLYSTSYQDGFANKKAPGVSKVSDVLNERLKNVPGFKEVDSGYKEAADLVNELKSNVLTKDGDFKGTLKALLGERGAKRMDILEKHFPGLKDKIETLAAYDDYLNTRNRKKVGLYEKAGAGAVAGFTMGGGLGAVIGAMVGPILSDFVRDPKWFKNYIVSKAGDNIANKIELGKKLNVSEKTRVNRALKEIIKNPQAALPYKGELGETPNTIIAPGKDIVTSPQGNFIKGQILDTNNSKNATANTSNIDDNSITTVKKKPVQSDTLVSEADIMEADRLANAQYIKEDIISNVQSIAKKNPEAIRKLLQKDGLPDNRIQSFIDDASNGKISERQAKNVSDALVSKSDSMSSKGRIDIYAELGDTRATKAYNNARLTNAEVKIKYKKGELKKQDIEDLIRARESNEMDDFIDRGKIIRGPDYNNTLRSLITDDIKPKDNQNIAVNKTEALKKELKGVKSDTLVSKTDSMSNRLNDYKNNQTSNYGPEQKQQSIDRIDYVVQGLRKSESPEDMKRFLSKIDLDDNYRNTFREVALDRKLGFREYFEKFNPHNFEQQMPKELYSKLKNIFIDDTMNINKPSILDKLDSLKASKELQPLYEEAKKYKSADEFIDGLKKKYSTRIDDLTKKQKLYNPDDPVGYNIAKEEYFKANGITKSDINIIENSKVANIKGMEDTYIQYKKRGQDDFADQQRKNIERAKISNSIFNKYDKVLEKRDNYYKKNEKNIMMNANKWMNNEDANFVMMIKNKLPNISQLRRIREEANRK